MRITGLQICQVAILCLATGACAKTAPVIEWGRPIDLGQGAYGRVHRLADERLMAAFTSGDGLVARFSKNGKVWAEPVKVAQRQTVESENGTTTTFLANAEFAQLETGRIVYACNIRPSDQRIDVQPYAIAVSTSDDGGRTWSALRTVHCPKPPHDGVVRGCYEPFILPGRGGRALLFFADETPYVSPPDNYQEISVMMTRDGGETWSKPAPAAYTPERRDGMPSVARIGEWLFLALEANPGRTMLHPQIVRRPARSGDWRRAERFDPLSAPPDWEAVYAGAPYIAATKNFVLLSWQEHRKDGDVQEEKTVARVAFAPKGKFLRNPEGAMLVADSPPCTEAMLWPQLEAISGDAFLLVAECAGRIKAFPGKIVKEGEVK